MRLVRGALVVLLGWWTLRLLTRATRWVFVDYVNLAFHEAGHVFLGVCGSTLHVLGGTLFQVLIPGFLVGYVLVRRQSAFTAACCFWWVGQNLINVSIYMADARELALPLVGGGDHDWNELFFRFGVLDEPSVRAIASTTRGLGAVIMILALVWACSFVLPATTRERLDDWIATRAPWAARLFSD